MAKDREGRVRHNENDGPGRCDCWLHRQRRLCINGAPYDEYQGTDKELVEVIKRTGGRVLV